jgi:hypothetical protein
MTENYKFWVTPSTTPETDYNAIIWSSKLSCTNVVDTSSLIMDLVKYTTELKINKSA